MADLDSWIDNLKQLLTMPGGPFDEGKKDNRNGLGTGSVKDWLTYPGDVYVEPESDDRKYKGDVAVHFSGRERKADYVAGVQTDTNDTQTSGRVTAKYEFTFGGSVLIDTDDVEKHGGKGRVGNAVVRHVQSLNGKAVSM